MNRWPEGGSVGNWNGLFLWTIHIYKLLRCSQLLLEIFFHKHFLNSYFFSNKVTHFYPYNWVSPPCSRRLQSPRPCLGAPGRGALGLRSLGHGASGLGNHGLGATRSSPMIYRALRYPDSEALVIIDTDWWFLKGVLESRHKLASHDDNNRSCALCSLWYRALLVTLSAALSRFCVYFGPSGTHRARSFKALSAPKERLRGVNNFLFRRPLSATKAAI